MIDKRTHHLHNTSNTRTLELQLGALTPVEELGEAEAPSVRPLRVLVDHVALLLRMCGYTWEEGVWIQWMPYYVALFLHTYICIHVCVDVRGKGMDSMGVVYTQCSNTCVTGIDSSIDHSRPQAHATDYPNTHIQTRTPTNKQTKRLTSNTGMALNARKSPSPNPGAEGRANSLAIPAAEMRPVCASRWALNTCHYYWFDASNPGIGWSIF